MTASQAQTVDDPGAAPGTAAPAAPVAPSIVVHTDATAEQLAALVVVLAAASGGDQAASESASSTWASHSAAMRHPVTHGPGAWRTALRH